MTQAKLQKFKTFPTTFLFEEFFKLEINYMHPIKLPVFPKEFLLDSSDLKKGFKKISAFAISKYLIQDLTKMEPKSIFQNWVSQTQSIFVLISQAKSNSLEKTF